ncbi:MAG: CPBP family intramembrane metalloprotease [Eubacterium sp.]|nr:CPBP family intramembrane metalloprotease [Eubacterium sp.]
MKVNNNQQNQTTNKEYNYFTYPRNFVPYKWAKPILVFILFIVIYLILSTLIAFAIGASGYNITGLIGGGYDAMEVTTARGALLSVGTVSLMLPVLAFAIFVVKDRPYSSYSSARGGWNYKIFFLSMLVALIIYVIGWIISYLSGNLQPFNNQFSLIAFILVTVLVPIQCVSEEYLFRGLLMQTIGSWTRLPIFALVIQTAIFIALHPYNITGRISVGISAVVFGLCAWAGRGLEVSSALHVVNNLFAFYMSGFGVDPIASNVPIRDLFSSEIKGVIFLVVMLIIIRKCSWFRQIKKDDITPFNEKTAARAEKKRAGKK